MRPLAALCVVLALALPLAAEETASPERSTDDVLDMVSTEAHVKEAMTHQIMSYLITVNLVNGLNLTEDQMRSMLVCLREAEKLRRGAEWDAVLAGYLDVASRLERGTALTEEDRAVFINSESLFQRLVRAGPPEAMTQIGKLADQVREILREDQLVVIQTFVPCHLPPIETEDPVRAGQAADHGRFLGILLDARTLPEGEFAEWFQHAVLPVIQRRVRSFADGMTLDTERERVLTVLRRARGLTEAEFQLGKADLARALDLAEEPTPGPVDEEGVGERIRSHLLDTRLIPLLERRLGEPTPVRRPATPLPPPTSGGT